MAGAVEPPFGAHALPPALERLRRFGAGLGRGAAARRLTSVIRRLCLDGRPDPVDLEPFPGQRARLYPRDNLSEKRVFGAPQFWDWAEREALAAAMARAPAPFHFVDAGANAGLYSLAVRSLGPARILSVEPEPGTLARLRVNLAASGAAEVRVAPVALGAGPGRARIAAPEGNRGEAALGEHGAEVEVVALLALLEAEGFSRVDALKIDIEGREAPVLEAFFRDAGRALWPGLVVIEAPRGRDTPALALLLQKGYVMAGRTRLNAILSAPERERAAGTGTAAGKRNSGGADGEA